MFTLIAIQVTIEEIDKSFDALVEVVNSRRQQVKDQLKESHETRHRSVNEQLVEIDNKATQLLAIREKLEDATCKGMLLEECRSSLLQFAVARVATPTDFQFVNGAGNKLDHRR